jgi:hypothetical protein
MDRYPDRGADPEGTTDGVELLEDRTRRIGRGGATRRLGISVPGAVAGAFLVTALAFGAALGPAAFRQAPSDGAGTTLAQVDEPKDEPADVPKDDGGEEVTPVEPGDDGGEPKDEPGDDGGEPKDEPGDEPKDEPAPDEPKDEEPTDQPKDEEPTDQPKDDPSDIPTRPNPVGIELGLRLDGSKVIVDWSACEADAFLYYLVVRSPDAEVVYPRGENDVVVGKVEQQATTAFADAAPGGKKLWYRVVGVAEWYGKTYKACLSDAAAIATPEPKPEPKPTPEPEPDVQALGLEVGIHEGHPWLEWSACEADGFDYYKVVRSKDSTVRFPAGDNDAVVAAVGADGKRAFYDKEAPGGKTLWYRVFCVDKSESGYRILGASAAKAVETPYVEPTPIPDPKHMGFEVDVVEGAVVLHWEACGGELFHYYKVVRSRSENPSYLPGTEGSEVIAVIENPSATEWVDGVDDGGTWFYRVQAIGVVDGQKVLLGQTGVRSVTLD